MTCEGCSGAINRVLKKAQDADGEYFTISQKQIRRVGPEITEFSVSLEKQEVIVKSSNLNYEDVKVKIAKTGKEVGSGYYWQTTVLDHL